MLPRFLVPALDPGSREAALPPEEAHHLTRVLRLKAGDDVLVFDGRGQEFVARVAAAARGAVTVTLLQRVVATAQPAVSLTLVQSVLKGDAMDQVIRDCTMVGVDGVQPIVSARTTVKTALMSKAAERWRRIALASAKQCGRATLPEIDEAIAFETWLADRAVTDTFILLEPSAAPPGAVTVRHLAQHPAPARATLVVGPEGGWTEEERDRALQAGCTPLTLGRMTLRANAVPLAAAAALLAVWEA
jgi:16S rRNA (uracil1498-N3)-methyltransferase